MKSICLFSSYFNQDKIPYYIKYYLEELKNHFTEIIFITNQKILADTEEKYLKKLDINLLMVTNEGFDFGMWYNAMGKYDLLKYDRVGLVNDSCILFKEFNSVFDFINKSGLDYCGLVDSHEKSYHLQSYFVVINKNAIGPVNDYFTKHGIIKKINSVIDIYEIGLSSYLLSIGVKIGAVFSLKNDDNNNPAFYRIEELLQLGIPVIKKKILKRNTMGFQKKRFIEKSFNPNPYFYIRKIKSLNKHNLPKVDYDKLFNDTLSEVSKKGYLLYFVQYIQYYFYTFIYAKLFANEKQP